MAFHKADNLERLAGRLTRAGLDDAARRLLELRLTLAENRARSTWFGRNSDRVMAVVSRHVENASSELVETGRLLDVARRLIVERSQVSSEDMEAARSQLLDLLKTLPASAVFAGTFLIPVPGAQPILAPVLMERLGLLPSSWQENRLITELRDLVRIARRAALPEVAEQLAAMLAEVRAHSLHLERLRRYIRQNPDWLIFFDENLDRRISEEELGILQTRIRNATRVAAVAPDEPHWNVYYRGDGGEDKVRNNLTFHEVRHAFPDGRNALVRCSEEDWWVPLWAIYEEIG